MQVTHDDIVDVIKTAKVTEDPAGLRSDLPLSDQGIDSLGMFSVILALQEKYSIEIEDPDIDRLKSIDDILNFLGSSAD